MTMSGQKRVRFLRTVHVIAMLGLAAWWATYFWQHTPAREELVAMAATRQPPVADAASALERRLDDLEHALRLVGDDLAFGVTVLVFLAAGTGAYVRRLEIWLEARTSGQAVAFGAQGLEGEALVANTDRIRRGP